jgi:hypothetical protein
MPHTEEGTFLVGRWMLLIAERTGEQRKGKYAVIEHIERCYEAQEEVPSGGLARGRSEPEQVEANRMEAQKGANGRLSELFEDLGLALPNEASDEDARRELYTVVASIFA